ncbi:hypothetical protein KCP70_25040 [Salmonella enterica subsp. enterica]|nr:hypothetical protein KCP70_25040 [Salmonella enterica subsp. enterica]
MKRHKQKQKRKTCLFIFSTGINRETNISNSSLSKAS